MHAAHGVGGPHRQEIDARAAVGNAGEIDARFVHIVAALTATRRITFSTWPVATIPSGPTPADAGPVPRAWNPVRQGPRRGITGTRRGAADAAVQRDPQRPPRPARSRPGPPGRCRDGCRGPTTAGPRGPCGEARYGRPSLRRRQASSKGTAADDGAGVCASGDDISADAARQVKSCVRIAVYLMRIVIAILRRLLILGLIGAAAWAAYRYTSQPPTELVLTGTVTTHEIVVSAKIGGRIQRLAGERGRQDEGTSWSLCWPPGRAAAGARLLQLAPRAGSQVAESEAALRRRSGRRPIRSAGAGHPGGRRVPAGRGAGRAQNGAWPSTVRSA